jgi:hypothetical protein
MDLKVPIARPRLGFPGAYRQLLAGRQMRLLLAGLGISSLGDGISTVTIAWLAIRIAPEGSLGLFVGLAVAAYTLPGIIGALTLGRILRGRPARALVLAHSLLRAGCLSLIGLLAVIGALTPPAYVGLLAASSLMAAWGKAAATRCCRHWPGPMEGSPPIRWPAPRPHSRTSSGQWWPGRSGRSIVLGPASYSVSRGLPCAHDIEGGRSGAKFLARAMRLGRPGLSRDSG